MNLLGGRPVWSMSGSELLSGIDTLDAEIARLQTDRLHMVAQVDEIGYAEELGARDTVQLLEFRYRMNGYDARRDVRLARALPRYHGVSAALAEHDTPGGDDSTGDDSPGDDGPGDDGGLQAAAAPSTADTADGDGEGVEGGMTRSTAWILRPAQAEAIVSTLERFASRIPVEDRDVIEQELVGLAAHLSPHELRKAATESCELIDADGPEPDEAKAFERESLKLSRADHGVKFNGFLANDNAELLRSLVDLGAKPRKTVTGEFDPRPRDKRQADALSAALSIAAAASDTGFPTRPGTTPPTSTTAEPAAASTTNDASSSSASTSDGESIEDTLFGTDCTDSSSTAATNPTAADTTGTGETNAHPADTPAATGATGSWVPGLGAKANITVTIDFNDLKNVTANATGQLVYGDNLSAGAVRRLACDANIIPLVLGSNSEPLDVGRSERLVNRAMRRALNARDKGCVVCGAPPIYCDAHHLTHWIDGGETRVDNLVLLCRRHHVDLHHGHWTITIVDGAVQVTRPTWADPAPRHKPKLGTYQHRLHRRAEPSVDDATRPMDDASASVDGAAPVVGDAARPVDAATRSRAPGRSSTRSDTATATATATAGTGAVGLVCPQPGDDNSTARPDAPDLVRPQAGAASPRDHAAERCPLAGSGRAAGVSGAGETSPGGEAQFDVWGDPVSAEQSPRQRSRWQADAGDLEEAARFAVWGTGLTTDAPSESTVPGGGVAVGQATHTDPWADTTLPYLSGRDAGPEAATLLNN
ncbi:HNH endonuclease signature motif containing protein [Kribbella antiqua]|nr:HNH endonuclease signature motif containing protein [Kribbella antiqua]